MFTSRSKMLVSKEIHAGKKIRKVENGNSTEDIHVNDTSNTSPWNYDSMNAGLDVTQEAVDTEIIEVNNSDSEEEVQILDIGECEIIDELDFREWEQIPHVTVKLIEGQVLEEFMFRRRYRISRERKL